MGKIIIKLKQTPGAARARSLTSIYEPPPGAHGMHIYGQTSLKDSNQIIIDSADGLGEIKYESDGVYTLDV